MHKSFSYGEKYPKLEIKDTGKYGKGVFACEDIKKGRIIYILGGERMDCMDLVKKVNTDNENIDDPFQIGKRTYLDLNEYSRTFNHSCDPSAGIRKNSEMFAIRDISAGEQITYDYSLTIAPTEWNMKCCCESGICRKILGDIQSIGKVRLGYYLNVGAVQRYMKLVIKDLAAGRYKVPPYEKKILEMLKKTSN